MPIGDLLAQISGEQPKPSLPSAYVAPPKRKADNDLQRGSDKTVKREPPAATTPRPVNQVHRTPTSSTSISKPVSHRQPALSTAVKTSTTKSSSAPPASALSKQDAVKVPKKGSFAEIMARAKAAQNTMAQVGKIQHKRIEKAPSKREREEMRSATATRDTNGKTKSKGPTPPLRDGRNGARENGKGSRPTSIEPERKVKKAAAATTGYTGTARPNPAALKKAPQSYGSSSRDRDRPSGAAPRPRYTYAASEDEEEEDYESDVSSDMEAAVFEVDEEEERAARLARKEDALALAEENRLKREKEEKRRRLAAMAKTRR